MDCKQRLVPAPERTHVLERFNGSEEPMGALLAERAAGQVRPWD
jgi:hypothetical protein